ncbi:MAG: exosome complex protein Rrp42 [Candidatus Thermoplasmatota archaeon]|nr:exosome complex protein Rrp42 [Candidatus Thermoplasmatota archaeon]
MDIISLVNRDFIKAQLKEGKRIDGRGFDDVRDLEITTGLIGTAEGSALVKLGNTKILVGVKLAVDKPFPDTPDEGILITNAELRPAASPTFEQGPPNPEAIEFARVVDRGIREGQTVDLKKLCITEGEKVWIVFLDIHVLDYDGNLFDAGNYGAVSALLNAKVPEHEGRESFDMPVLHTPVSCTFAKIDDSLLIDPGLEEESVADARLTVVLDEEKSIRAMQKGLEGSFKRDEIKEMIDRASRKSEEIRKKIDQRVKL